MSYVPFLKYKVNEISALKALSSSDKERITPFFDLPRRDELDSETLTTIIKKAHRKYELNLKSLPYFYIDNFDIDDNILINGDNNYSYVLDIFSEVNIIPVVGIDRSKRRNEVVLEAKTNEQILTNIVALRICAEDFVSYPLVKDEINELIESLDEQFDDFHLVIDNRVCHGLDTKSRAAQIMKFIVNISEDILFDSIIVTGSSIPASIRELLPTKSTTTILRSEVEIFNKVSEKIPDVIFGDYTVVSPNYSDVKIKSELMRTVTSPKLMYCFDEQLHIKRGAAIEGHPRGNKQYNDLSAELIKEKFFRTAKYSFGDQYIVDKANDVGNDATPSTIPKPLINAHITYMLNDFT